MTEGRLSRWRDLLVEVKRRKLFRALAVYAAAVFVVLQAADILVPALGLSAALMTGLAVGCILGFPLVAALAWAFELTPEGVKRTPVADTPEAVAERQEARTARWLDTRTTAAVLVLVVLGIGISAGWFLRPAMSGAEDGEAVADAPGPAAGAGLVTTPDSRSRSCPSTISAGAPTASSSVMGSPKRS